MTENLAKLNEAAKENEALAKELNEIKGANEAEVIEKVIAVGNNYGFELEAADFESNDDELSLDELESVAGGGFCLGFGARKVDGVMQVGFGFGKN